MRNEQGFVVVELLMQGLMVAGFVLVTSLVGVHSAVAISTVSASQDQAHFAALRWDLENLDARQAIYYADERSYSSSSIDLGFTPSEGVTVSIHASPLGWAATATHLGLVILVPSLMTQIDGHSRAAENSANYLIAHLGGLRQSISHSLPPLALSGPRPCSIDTRNARCSGRSEK